MRDKNKVSSLISGLVIDELLQLGLIDQKMADRAKELFLIEQRRHNGGGMKGVA